MTGPEFSELWAVLSEETRNWLADHNGEVLTHAVLVELLDASHRVSNPAWLDAENKDGPCLTDATVDWVEATANGE